MINFKMHLNMLGDCIVDDLAVATNAIEFNLPAPNEIGSVKGNEGGQG